jgi:hypothetical protein
MVNKSDNDVNGFTIRNANTLKFPANLEKVFKGLILIQIYNISDLTGDDLKPFPQLRFLLFEGNQMTAIRDDWFVHTPLLEEISFYSNQIEHIDVKAFDGLSKLRVLFLASNACGLYGNDVANLVRRVKAGKCQSDRYKTTKTTQNPLEIQIGEQMTEIEGLKSQIQKLQNDAEREKQNLVDEILSLNKKFVDFNDMARNLTAQNENLERKIDRILEKMNEGCFKINK